MLGVIHNNLAWCLCQRGSFIRGVGPYLYGFSIEKQAKILHEERFIRNFEENLCGFWRDICQRRSSGSGCQPIFPLFLMIFLITRMIFFKNKIYNTCTADLSTSK